MQKLTLINFDNNKKYIISKFNIGQRVFIIEWHKNNPIIMDSYILSIGIDDVMQTEKLIYNVDRMMKENIKKYYDNEIFGTKIAAAKHIIKLLKKTNSTLKEIINHPYYKIKGSKNDYFK